MTLVLGSPSRSEHTVTGPVAAPGAAGTRDGLEKRLARFGAWGIKETVMDQCGVTSNSGVAIG